MEPSNLKKVILNPIPTGNWLNQPKYSYQLTQASRNGVKRFLVPQCKNSSSPLTSLKVEGVQLRKGSTVVCTCNHQAWKKAILIPISTATGRNLPIYDYYEFDVTTPGRNRVKRFLVPQCRNSSSIERH